MKTLTCLFVGLGSIGQRHLRNLRQILKGNLRPIALRALGNDVLLQDGGSAQHGVDLTTHYGIEAFSQLEAALNQEPDLALVCNPTSLHVPVAQKIAEAGCHLFVEKPLSHSLEGVGRLLKTAQDRALITMVGFQFRFHPLLTSLRNQLESERIGQVLGALAEWGEYLPHWHPWEDYRTSYAAKDALGGGVVLTLIHPLDYLLWLFGPVRRVHASVRRIPTLQTQVTDDLAEITLEFSNEIVAHVHLDYIQSPPTHTLTVWGDAGRAHLDFHTGILQWLDTNGNVETETVPGGFSRNHLFLAEMQHLIECLTSHQATQTPLEEGARSLRIAIEAKGNALQKHANPALV